MVHRRPRTLCPVALATAVALVSVASVALRVPPPPSSSDVRHDGLGVGGEVGAGVGGGGDDEQASPLPTRRRFVGLCNRVPPGVLTDKSPGYNNFSIVISGSPKKYVPGEAYTGE
ncbi:unnamed protein product, partial [Ixodes pacificus]